MATQKNTRAIGENRAGKSISMSSGFLDVFIGSANFKSTCEAMHIRYEEPKTKSKKK